MINTTEVQALINKIKELEEENKALKDKQIIHCKDCKYFQLTKCFSSNEVACCERNFFTSFRVDVDGSGFCSWAKRREK